MRERIGWEDRVCKSCGKWVYYDNGDCTYSCGCSMGWIWEHEFKKSNTEAA